MGSRGFKEAHTRVKKCINRQKALYGERIIIYTGGGGSVDWAAMVSSIEVGLRCVIIPANWQKYGSKAGPIRNEKIVKQVDKIYAFWDGKSKGTQNVIQLAKSMKVPVVIRREER